MLILNYCRMDTIKSTFFTKAYFLGNKEPTILPFDGNLTMREWKYKIADLFPPITINKNTLTFNYAILQKGKDTNLFENPHKLISNLIDFNMPVYCTLGIFHPVQFASIKGNLNNTGFDLNKTCSICLEEMLDMYITLDCLHRFHMKCIKQLANTKCPLCNKNSHHIEYYKLYSKGNIL